MQITLLLMLFAAVFGATWLLMLTLLPDRKLRRLQQLAGQGLATPAPVGGAAPSRRATEARGAWRRLCTVRERRAALRGLPTCWTCW